MFCLMSKCVKFPNLSIMTGLEIETAVATAVARFMRSIVLLFTNIFKLDSFTGSIMLLLHIGSWTGAGIVDLTWSGTNCVLSEGLSTAVAWRIEEVVFCASNCAILCSIILNILELCVCMVDVVDLESDCIDCDFLVNALVW